MGTKVVLCDVANDVVGITVDVAVVVVDVVSNVEA